MVEQSTHWEVPINDEPTMALSSNLELHHSQHPCPTTDIGPQYRLGNHIETHRTRRRMVPRILGPIGTNEERNRVSDLKNYNLNEVNPIHNLQVRPADKKESLKITY